MHKTHKVFLDANVLFSAAYTPNSRLVNLWSMRDVRLITSVLALEEARRNLAVHRPEALVRLDGLSQNLMVINNPPSILPEHIELAEKDIPILTAAMSAGCSYLLTGDNQHFGSLYGKTIEGVLILTPSQYLSSRTS